MTEDLMIGIGADLSAYNSALKSAESAYNNMVGKFNKNTKKPRLGVDLKQYFKDLKDADTAFNKTLSGLRDKAKSVGIDVHSDEVEKELQSVAKRIEASNRQTIDNVTTIKKQAEEAEKVRRAKVYKELELMGIKFDKRRKTHRLEIQALAARQTITKELETQKKISLIQQKQNQDSIRKSLNNQKIIEQAKTKASLNAQKEAALQEKRIQDIAIKSKKATYDRIIKIKHLSDRKEIASEYRKLRAMSHKQLREYEKTEFKKTKIYQAQAARRNADSAVGRSFLDSVKVVAKYGAISQVLYGIQNSITSVITSMGEFDVMIQENIGVLGVTRKEAIKLGKEVQRLAIKYGAATTDIHKSMLALGRAGIGADEIQAYTEQVVALATITGDTLEDSAEAVVSFKEVYTEMAQDVEQFSGRMAYVVNETILGMADLKIVGNYALSAAASINLSYDSLLGLAGAFSKIGKQPSTIGTSIRRLGDISQSTTEKMQTAWRKLGVDQEQLQKDFATGGEVGKKALRTLITQLGNLKKQDTSRFQNALKGLEVRSKELLSSLAQIQDVDGVDLFAQFSDSSSAVNAIAQAEKASKSFSKETTKLKERFKAAWTDAGVSFQEAFTPILQSLNEEGPDGANKFATSVKVMAEIMMKAISVVINGVTTLVSSFVLAWGGIQQLSGFLDQKAGEALGGVSTEEYQALQKNYELKKKEYDLAVKNKELSGVNRIHARNDLRNIRKKIKAYEDMDSFVQKLTIDGENERKKGDETEAAIRNLWETTIQATHALNDIDVAGAFTKANEEQEKLKKNIKEGHASQEGAVEAAIKYKNTIEQTARIEKDKVLTQLRAGGNMTPEKAQTELLKIELKYRQDIHDEQVAFFAKAENAGADQTKLLDAEHNLQVAIHNVWKDKNKELSKSSRAAREASRIAKYKMQIEKEMSKQKVIQEKIDLKLGKGQISLQSNALKAAIKLKKEATALVKTNKKLVIDDRTRLELKKSETKELEAQLKYLQEMTKEINKWTGIFDGIFSGDFGNALGSMFKDTFDSLKLNIADSIGGTLGSIAGGLTGSLINFGLDTLNGILSDTGRSQAEIDKIKGLDTSELTAVISEMGDTYADVQYPMLEVTNKMYQHLRSMDNNFYAIARSIAGVAGADLTGVGFSEGVYSANVYSSKTKELLSAGLQFEEATFEAYTQVGNSLIQGYEFIKTTKEYLWKTKVSEVFKDIDLDQSVLDDFTRTFQDGYNTIFEAGSLLGIDENYLETALANAKIQLGDEEGRIDLKGLDAEGTAAAIDGIFSSAFSGVIDQIPELTTLTDRYTQGLEEQIDTLLRISLEFDQASHMFGLIGKEFTDVPSQIMRTWTEDIETIVDNPDFLIGNRFINQIRGITETIVEITTETFSEMVDATYTAQMQILDIVESTGGIDNFTDAMNSFMSNFYTDTEQLNFLNRSMAQSFATLNEIDDGIDITMPQTKEEFRELLETFDTTTKEGAYLYGQILLLSEGFSQLADGLRTTLNDAELFTQYISSMTDFTSRQIALEGSELDVAAYAVTASEMMLDAITAQTKLYGITMDNYQDQFEAAHYANQLTEEQLDNWTTMGDALLNVAEAQKAYNEILQNDGVAAIEAIADAWLSNISYLTNAQKTEFASAYSDLAGIAPDDSPLDAVEAARSAAETALKTVATKEEYIPIFDRYIAALEAEVPEATLDDVLLELREITVAVKELEDTTIRIQP